MAEFQQQDYFPQLMDEVKRMQVLIRTNNLLMSRFILELSKVKKDLGLPKRYVAFRFELLEEEYWQLVNEFDKEMVDRALFQLDRLLLTNKQECPNNIARYIRKKLNRKLREKKYKGNKADEQGS